MAPLALGPDGSFYGTTSYGGSESNRIDGRAYSPQFTTNVVGGEWATLTGVTEPNTNGDQVTITDLNASESTKFDRIAISLQ